MLLKNLIRIISSYKFSIITIIFFELLYLVKGYKGNRFNFSNNDLMADNLPCPYYFLFKIKKTLKKNNFRNFFNKNFIGIEYFTNQFEYCKKVFQEQKNIKIIQADFTKSDFFQYDADCYFINGPFKKNLESIEFIEKIINFSLKKKILFIFINHNMKIV